MTLKEFFDSKPYGSKAELAKKVGISKTWMSLLISGKKPVSPELAIKLEVATSGGLTRQDLRPDLFGVAK